MLQMSSPLESVNANHTLLPSSPSLTVKVTESRTDTNLKPALEGDATSGKEKLWENYIQCIYVKICILIYLKNGKICQRYL